jgi:sugar-phosphatase
MMQVKVPAKGAVIFDLDGTLVDSTAVVERQWTAWARRNGVDPEQLMAVVHGRPSIQTMRMFVPETTIEQAEAFDRIEEEDTDGLRQIQGARAVVQQCIDRGIRWAIVTSGTHRMATLRLATTGFPRPEVFVTVELTPRGKPNPDPFLRAAELLRVQPKYCVVFEDSNPGVLAGKAAGMRVIALETTTTREHISGADAILKDFTEVEIVPESLSS